MTPICYLHVAGENTGHPDGERSTNKCGMMDAGIILRPILTNDHVRIVERIVPIRITNLFYLRIFLSPIRLSLPTASMMRPHRKMRAI